MTIIKTHDDPSKLPALLYHAQHQGYMEDIPFWKEMAARFGSPILELGCGTGRIFIPLTLDGYLIYGLDNNYEMLEVLIRNQFLNSLKHLKVFQADVVAFKLMLKFSLIFMACNTFSTFEEQRRQAILKTVSKHLSPGCAFVVSLPNPILLEKLPARSEEELDEIIQHPVTGNPVQVLNSWQRKGQIFKLNWFYDHLAPDGTVDRVNFKIHHHIVNPENYRAELLAAGFSSIDLYGDFDFSEYRSDSNYLILMAIKR